MTRVAPMPVTSLVRVQGGRFVRGGPADTGLGSGPFVPRGVGSYPLLDHSGRGRVQHVRDVFAQARDLDRPLVRTHAFFDGGDSPARLRNADGTPHEPGLRALDGVLAEARAHGVQLLLPVANHWPDYGGARAVAGMVLGASRAAADPDAFYLDPRCVRAQQVHIEALMGRVNHLTGVRYGDDPTVFAWELANEPRLSRAPRARLRRLVQPSRRLGPALAAWAVAMRRAFDAGGAQQLVGWGGSGHRGTHGEDMEPVLASGAVDFATLHLYPFATHPALLRRVPWDARASAAVGVGRAILADRAALAARYGLPLLVEELGWKTGAHTLGCERLQVMRGLLQAARELSVGTLPWMIAERGRADYDGLVIRPEHAALWDLLRAA
ncbi:MAG: hypothetical protein R3B40_23155 [Polyangiales bacterium]|nr:hypothetical protein [Sandaracinaceae bacterium]